MEHLSTIQRVVVLILPLLFAITVHEVAHGWIASKLGDKTALMMGRLTLNPLKHIDLIGTIIVPAILMLMGGFIFGWAKPVPVNFNNLRNSRRDMALVAAAGPVSNLLMAFIWAFITKLALFIAGKGFGWAVALAYMGRQAGIVVNIVLMVLNLFPIPPLDGGRIVSSLLPVSAAEKYNYIERFGFFILLALLATGILWQILHPIVIILIRLVTLLVWL